MDEQLKVEALEYTQQIIEPYIDKINSGPAHRTALSVRQMFHALGTEIVNLKYKVLDNGKRSAEARVMIEALIEKNEASIVAIDQQIEETQRHLKKTEDVLEVCSDCDK